MSEASANTDTGWWMRRGSIWVAGASIALVIVNAALMLRNQDAQRTVNQRQAIINQETQVSRVNQVLMETIARTAVARKDDTLVALLERHGIRINQTAAPAATTAPATGGHTP